MIDLLKLFKGIETRHIFVPYKMVWNEARQKYDKVPCNNKGGISTKEPSKWMPLQEALDMVTAHNAACGDEKDHWPGIGIVFTGGIHRTSGNHETLVGFDFDDVDFAKFKPPFVTYWERSPSGKGLRAFAWVPSEWAAQFADSLKVPVPNCSHAEVYFGESARFLTLTGNMVEQDYKTGWRDKYDRIRSLSGKPQILKEIAAWRGLNKAESAVAKQLPEIPDGGAELTLARFNLSIDQRHLLAGTGGINRSDTSHGLIIKLLDAGASQSDVLATMIRQPHWWQYLLDHRNDDPARALQFAHDEIGRAYLDSMTGRKANLYSFNRKVEVVEEQPRADVIPIRGVPTPAADPVSSELAPVTPASSTPGSAADPEQPAVAYPKPFRGALADIVNASLEVQRKPQPELTMLAALVAMAASCGSYFARSDGSTVNLYGIGVLPTGTGKDAPLKLCKTIASLGNVKLINASASGAGLEDHLASNRGTLSVVDEIGHLIAITNSRNAPSWLKDLSAKMLTFYSAGADSLVVPRTKVGKEAEKIANPALSSFGVTTPKVLGRALTLADIEDGTAGRHIWVKSSRDPNALIIDAKLEIPKSFQKKAMKVESMLLHRFAQGKPILIGLADDAQALRRALNDEFDQCGRGNGSPHERALCARSLENTERIAGALAVWDNPDKPMITAEHLEWGAQFIRASNATALEYVETEIGSGEQQRNAADVLELLQKGVFKPMTDRKGRPRESQVAALAASDVPWAVLQRDSRLGLKDFKAAIDHLLSGDQIDVDSFGESGLQVVRLRTE